MSILIDAKRIGLAALEWVKTNGLEFIDKFCTAALITRESIAPQGTFNPSAIGVHNFATTVNGSLNSNQYGLYFKVTEDEFNQVIREQALN